MNDQPKCFIDLKETSLEEINSLKRPFTFTNGVFDILHLGHAEYLANSKQRNGSLIVGVNSDISTKLLGKGPNRPINNEDDRARLLSSIKCVDAVIIFDDSCPLSLISLLKPEFYTKGGDYDLNNIPESKLVKELGGEVIKSEFKKGYSSSDVIKKASK